MARISELTKEIRQKHVIIDQFIPPVEYLKIERRAAFDESRNEYVIPNIELTGNQVAIEKAKRKEGKGDSNTMMDNIINFDESEGEENFEEAATKRVNEAISSIIMEE